VDFYFHVGERALTTILMIAGPILGLALVVGLGVGLLQAVTQMQEQTLAFLPKALAIVAILFLLGPWMIDELSQLARFVAGAIAEGPRP
jgi:flagellar biosynthetic protein FliQ